MARKCTRATPANVRRGKSGQTDYYVDRVLVKKRRTRRARQMVRGIVSWVSENIVMSAMFNLMEKAAEQLTLACGLGAEPHEKT